MNATFTVFTKLLNMQMMGQSLALKLISAEHLMGKMTQCLQDERSLGLTKMPLLSKQNMPKFQQQSSHQGKGTGWRK